MWLIVSYNNIFHLLVNPTENHTCWLLILGKWLIFYFENVFNCFIWTIPVFKYMFTTCHVPTLSHSSESQYHIIISLSSLCRHIWRRHSTYEMLIMNILSSFSKSTQKSPKFLLPRSSQTAHPKQPHIRTRCTLFVAFMFVAYKIYTCD